MTESVSTEWTDEKHSLYLKSMEASFVNQLYESMDVLGFCRLSDPTYSRKKHFSNLTPSGQVPPLSLLFGVNSLYYCVCGCLLFLFLHCFFFIFFNLYSFSQFKVHRNGGWQRINFERAADAQLIQKADGSDGFLANPWIQHFRPGCNPHVVASTDVRKNGASTSQATCYSKQIPACDSHLCHHNLVGSDTGAISLLFA